MHPPSRPGLAALGAAALLVAAMPWFASAYAMGLVTAMLVWATFALSLQLLVGGTGMVSLGHAAFFGIGAYTVNGLGRALGTAPSLLLSLPAAALAGAVAAAAVGVFALRTRGFFFLMTTLAFGQMLFFLFHDTALGGGTDGVFVLRPVFAAAGWAWVPARAQRPAALLLTSLAALAACYLLLAWLMRTLFGRALQGIRANEHRMGALGFPTYRYKLAAFVLAGALAGVAGHMWAMTQGFISPELLGWHHSAEALLMIVLGGSFTLAGPLLGAFALLGLEEASQMITAREHLVEGLVILAVVLLLPRGLAGVPWPRLRR